MPTVQKFINDKFKYKVDQTYQRPPDVWSNEDNQCLIDSIIKGDRFKIVFNMSEISFMSSAGLRQMIETMKTCRRFNRGNLVLSEAPQNMREVLDLAGLTPIFKFYESEVEAVGSF